MSRLFRCFSIIAVLGFLSAMPACSLKPVAFQDKNTLQSAFKALKASLSIIRVDGVYRDYIHQTVYLRSLLNEINTALAEAKDLQDVKSITGQLNAVTTTGSVGQIWGASTYSAQRDYYRLPNHKSPSTLGRKAVGTAIFDQYILDLLKVTETNLKKSEAGTLGAFIAVNDVGFANLSKLTKAYYAQAGILKRSAMNLGFDYEKKNLVHFKEPLKKFYKK